MKISFKKAFDQIINSGILKIDDVIDNIIEITETKYNRDRVVSVVSNLIEDNQDTVFSLDYKNIIFRSKVSENRVFYINLTKEEIQDKKLYIGHRLFPFVHLDYSAKAPQFILDNNTLEMGTTYLSHHDSYKYIILQLLEIASKRKYDENGIHLFSLDLKHYLSGKESKVSFEARVESDRKVINLRRLRPKEIAENSLLCKVCDEKIHNKIMEHLKNNSDLVIFDDLMLNVFDQLPASEIPRFSSIANIVNNQKEFALQYIYGLTTVDVTDKPQPKIPDIPKGVARDLQGILTEMGLTLSENFIYCLIYEMTSNDSFDFQWILMDLFEIELRIDSDKQFDNLQKAFTELANKVLVDFNSHKPASVDLKALSKFIDATLQIVFFVRDIDIKFGNDNEFDLNQLLPLLEVDKLIEGIFEKFRHKKKFSTDERKGAEDVLNGVNILINSLKERLF